MNVKVEQECFKTLHEFSMDPSFRKGNGKAGVYIWGFSLEETDFTIPSSSKLFFPYYVGKQNKDMYWRTHEHIASLMGGNYSIFNIRNCFHSGTMIGNVLEKYRQASKIAKPKESSPILPSDLYPNLLHFPEGINTLDNFFKSRDIKNELDWMIKHFCITYLIPENTINGDIDALEKIVGNIIGYDKLITRHYKLPKDYHIEIINSPRNIILNDYEDIF